MLAGTVETLFRSVPPSLILALVQTERLEKARRAELMDNIEREAYAVSPACFEAFAAGRELAPATVRNRVVRLGRHRRRASPSGAANVFRAMLADGSRVKGMVFPGELIWDDDPPPRANAGLVGKGR